MIIDITTVLEALFTLVMAVITAFLIPWLREKQKSDKLAKIFSVAEQVVYAAWELDITGELIELGVTKVEYAWNEARKILAQNNITVDDDELKAYIKSEVAKLRISRGDTILEDTE